MLSMDAFKDALSVSVSSNPAPTFQTILLISSDRFRTFFAASEAFSISSMARFTRSRFPLSTICLAASSISSIDNAISPKCWLKLDCFSSSLISFSFVCTAATTPTSAAAPATYLVHGFAIITVCIAPNDLVKSFTFLIMFSVTIADPIPTIPEPTKSRLLITPLTTGPAKSVRALAPSFISRTMVGICSWAASAIASMVS